MNNIPLFMIKPLEWRKIYKYSWEATTVFGILRVSRNGNGVSVWLNDEMLSCGLHWPIREVLPIAERLYKNKLEESLYPVGVIHREKLSNYRPA